MLSGSSRASPVGDADNDDDDGDADADILMMMRMRMMREEQQGTVHDEVQDESVYEDSAPVNDDLTVCVVDIHFFIFYQHKFLGIYSLAFSIMSQRFQLPAGKSVLSQNFFYRGSFHTENVC